ncbi:MAG: aminotransferase class V-fold PLP-dependent enzyme [Bdellovibrionales bacterium]|nr:aminotransferase class V-fold PLP-dependent enzyme [Bdellovibrionales bacterium]
MNIELNRISFASDNNSGVIPEALDAIQKVNQAHVPAYGNDPVTEYARVLFKDKFGAEETFFVFNGTGANNLCLKAMLKSFEAVICASTSHLNHDEGGAPENVLGTKLYLIPTEDGKIRPEQIKAHIFRMGDPHRAQPRVLSITQPTEYGTVYTIEEMKALSKEAKRLGLYFHIDGSRLVHACTSLGVSLREITKDVGADAVSFGGTKNGLMVAEACVFFDKTLAKYVPFYQKQFFQLAGKSRYVAAQFIAFLENDIWKKYSENCLRLAKKLEEGVRQQGIQVTQKVQANTVFAIIPKEKINEVREKFFFYIWDEFTNEVRWMTTWDTTDEMVDSFLSALL